MKIIDCAQGSPEWWERHRGKPSASNFSRILTAVGKRCVLPTGHKEPHRELPHDGEKLPSTKNRCQVKIPQLSAGADAYIAELVADMANLYPMERPGVVTHSMANGINTEAEARRWYEFEVDCDVQQVGCCLTDDERFICSPDGLVGEEGGLELKCPEHKTQVGWLLDGVLPNDHKAQVHGCLIVTGRKWWDFLSYAPGLDHLKVRVYPDGYTEALRDALDKFWVRYQEALAKVLRKDQ